jgi:hypothetical protein
MRSGLDALADEVFVGYTHKSPMHELGIMSSAMESVLQQAHARGAQRVHRIVLRIGALAGVEPESLRFAFDVVTRDTLARLLRRVRHGVRRGQRLHFFVSALRTIVGRPPPGPRTRVGSN